VKRVRFLLKVLLAIAVSSFTLLPPSNRFHASSNGEQGDVPQGANQRLPNFKSPAGNLPDSQHVPVGGYDGAVIPNGRLITPAGIEVSVAAPKAFGMALSPDGKTLATVNSGIGPFSISLIHDLQTLVPSVVFINVNATFMGITFSSDSSRFFASGGENGNVWVGDPVAGLIVGSVNLNGPTHPLTGPLDVTRDPPGRFKGVFAGALTYDGRYVYIVDQAGFQVHVIDTTRIVTGVNSSNQVIEPNNFTAVVGSVNVGRYPFGIGLSPDHKKLLVAHVGIFQYTSLLPVSPTGDKNTDFPLGYPGAGYPDETRSDRTINIHKVDPRALPDTLSIPGGIQVGYIDHDVTFTIPGLGSPNVPKASSIYVLDISRPRSPVVRKIAKTGPLVGQIEYGIAAYSRSHPNSVVWGPDPSPIYVSNGNNDSISILDRNTYAEVRRVPLNVFRGIGRQIKGVQPVALALSPDERTLYVAEAGINAIGVMELQGDNARLKGHIPVGWWPSNVQVSRDGKTLYVANANGRGTLPNDTFPPNNLGSPKSSTLGTVNIIPVPSDTQLAEYTERVLANNGFEDQPPTPDNNPIPSRYGTRSAQIKHVIFINKENSTYDQLLGDISFTRKNVPVNGNESYSLGQSASPNHHELALEFAFSDNFFLEPSVSSDGHQWLSDNYPTEFEQTHWPAAYGGERNDSGDDPNVFIPYPGRLGFTDANSSPDPQGYDQHGGIMAHLARNHRSFVNFGNGYEFAIVDEDGGTEPTGIRNHVNVPMEKVIRDHSDHLYPEFNTHIPDAPLPEDPTRFNRFGRFRQVFSSHYVDAKNTACKLPDYVDLYFPNDHGGGAHDINPSGPAWSYTRFVQDNDAALGMTVDLISHSPCWKDTAIFVVEDDTQNGNDHVDGGRSLFLAISPWVRHEYLGKKHYSLSSVFKTVNLVLGIPPLNQYDAGATDLRELFTSWPDFTPYNFTPIQYAMGANATWLALTKDIDFSRPDADEVKLHAAIMKSEGLPRNRK
jgi:DNA-binding beta-propeller fold protein YncE